MQTKTARRTGELDISDDVSLPFDTIALDVLLGFPWSANGSDAVLVITDTFSRMVLLTPCKASITAQEIAAVISDRVLRWGRRPRRLIPDSEARLTGEVMQSLATSLGAQLAPSVPHHHQANPAERCVQTVKHVLQALCVHSSALWDRRAVPATELAMNATPSVTTGYKPFDLVFISHPEVVHAVFDAGEHAGVGAFAERLVAAHDRLEDARLAIQAARALQKRNYDASRASLPDLRPGDRVFVRLKDRPLPGMGTDKVAARKQGPYEVSEVLTDHRVRLRLSPDMGIDDVFAVSQLDPCPREADPFVPHRPSHLRTGSDSSHGPPTPPDALAVEQEEPTPAPRLRRPPAALCDYDLEATVLALDPQWYELLRGPYHRPRLVDQDGRPVLLRQRPVAFLSRVTLPSEQKLVAAELELYCLAWSLGRFLHLLEGSDVTVVTDHAAMGAMLTATTGTKYGPVSTRCRALLMPHLAHLRFDYRAGSSHTNADALSRLVRPRPGSYDQLVVGM